MSEQIKKEGEGYGNRNRAESVLCPLFRAYRQNGIRCASHVPESSTVEICYQNSAACEKQRKLFCEGEWQRCEHYRSWEHMNWIDEE